MSKKPNILNVLAGFLSAKTINENFTRIADAFENTLSRDGSLPNHMNADIDMNSNDILNVDSISVNELRIEGQDPAILKNWAREAEDWALQSEDSASRANYDANRAVKAAEDATSANIDVQGATLFAANVASLLANTNPNYPVGTIFTTREEKVSYRVADPSATDYDAITAGGIKLYRLRKKRVIFAYSQSNFANQAPGVSWTTPPPENLFVWNGGNWNGDLVPPVGTSFVPASQRPPQVPVAYAAELARSRPEEDWFLIIVARGGTGIRALTGVRHLFRSSTSGSIANTELRFNLDNTQIAYSEVDLYNILRYTGNTGLGTSSFYPARVQTTLDGGASWIEFYVTSAPTDQGSYRTQQITVTGSNNWPPADRTDITVLPSEPRMRTLIQSVIPAAMDSIHLKGDSRKIDKLLVWPTESDINYFEAYQEVDFPYLLLFLQPWTTAATNILLTLPYPYGEGISLVRNRWWDTIRDITKEDSAQRTLISLENSGADNWGDDNKIHVLGPSLEVIGTLLAKSESTGGSLPLEVKSGFYTPTITPIANIVGTVAHEAMWSRNGPVVTVSGLLQIQPTAANAPTEVRISIPVDSNLAAPHDLVGSASVMGFSTGIIGEASNKTARVVFTSRSVLAENWSYQFSYRVR